MDFQKKSQLAKLLRLEPSGLAMAALCVWIISLFFTGFKYGFEGSTINGFYILLFGLPFGWMSNGWAVYANLFFISVFYKIIDNKKPIWSVLFMVSLAATLPFFKEMLVNENGGMLPVTAWGWGAVIWITALFMIACAALLQHGLLGERGGLVLVMLFVFAIFLSVYALHAWQLKQANEQEKTLFLNEMAFMTLEPCGTELAWPERQLIPPNEIIGVEIDSQLVKPEKGRPHLYLPLPEKRIEIEGNYEWIPYQIYNGIGIHVRQPKQDGHNYTVLKAETTQAGALIQLIGANKEILFEQMLNVKSLGDRTYYCPLHSQSQKEYPQRKLSEGVDTGIRRVLGVDNVPKIKKQTSLTTELAIDRCSFNMFYDKDNKLHGIMDGRNVIIDFTWMKNYAGFCSDNYVALVQVSEATKDNMFLDGDVFLFDRKTLRPIARFTNKPRKVADKFNFLKSSGLKSVLITQSDILVQTDKGQLLADQAEVF